MESRDPDIRLHVVYSGRGDAMYMTWTEGFLRIPHMIMIDGGPYKYQAAGAAPAPYWKYLRFAASRIWAQRGFSGTPQIEAIINTHPHDDHLDGILMLLQNLDNGLRFKGPLILTPYRSTNPDIVTRLYKTLVTELGYVSLDFAAIPKDLMSVLFFQNYQRKDLYYCAPPGSNVIPTTETRLEWARRFHETSDLNHISILNETNTSTQKKPRNVFLTGDNCAKNILPHVSGKHYTIYKIQHHGSREDSCIFGAGSGNDTSVFDKLSIIPAAVMCETAILFVLIFKLNIDGIASELYEELIRTHEKDRGELHFRSKWSEAIEHCPEDTSPLGISYLYTRIMHFSGTVDEGAYFVRLWRRYLGHQYDYDQDPGQFVGQAWDGKPTPKDVWDAVCEEINQHLTAEDKADKTYRDWFFRIDQSPDRPKTRGGGVSYEKQHWWHLWCQVKTSVAWQMVFKRTRMVLGAIKFFTSFSADSYVVSANGSHRHPSPETLAGLAFAVRKNHYPKASLFLTSADSFNLNTVYNIVQNLQFSHIFETLYGSKWTDLGSLMEENLMIYYMSESVFMSISAEPGLVDHRQDPDSTQRYGSADQRSYNELDLILEKCPETFQKPHDKVICCNWQDEKIYLTLDRDLIPDISQFPTRLLCYDFGSHPQARNSNHFVLAWSISGGRRLCFGEAIPSKSGGQAVEFELFWYQPGQNGMDETWGIYWNAAADRMERKLKSEIPPNRVKLGWYLESGSIQTFARNASVLSEQVHSLAVASTSKYVNIQGSKSSQVASTTPSLRQYLLERKIDPKQVPDGLAALHTLIRKDNFDRLKLGLKYQKQILALGVDYDESKVDYQGRNPTTGISSATISLVISEPKDKIDISGDLVKIISAKVGVLWGLDLTLQAILYITLEDETYLAITRKIDKATNKPSLAKVLISMGYTETEIKDLKIPNLLAMLLKDKTYVNRILKASLPSVLMKPGFPNVVADLDKSTASVTTMPSGAIAVQSVEIILNLAGLSTWKPILSMAGIDIEIKELRILLEDVMLLGQSIKLVGAASFSGIVIKMEQVFSLETPELTFMLTPETSLSKLTDSFPGKPSLSKEKIPLSTGKTIADLASSSLSEIGFTIAQPASQMSNYSISRIFAKTELADWKAYIPKSFPKIIKDVGVQLIVYQPLNNKSRAVAIGVDFEIAIKSASPAGVENGAAEVTDDSTVSAQDDSAMVAVGNGAAELAVAVMMTPQQEKALSLRFTAEPIGSDGGYEYTISANVDEEGLSLADVAETTNMKEFLSSLRSLPFVSGIVDNVYVRNLSLAVQQQKEGGKNEWVISDWDLKVWINRLDIFDAGLVELRNTTLDVAYSKQEKGIYDVQAVGVLNFLIPKKEIEVGFKMPHDTIQGVIYINSPDGLKFMDMLHAFKITSFDDVPVVKKVFEIELLSSQVGFGHEVKGSKDSWTFISAAVKLALASLSIGALDLTDIEFSATYSKLTKPDPDRYTFSISANMFDRKLLASVSYDNTGKTIDASLTAMPNALLKLETPLKKFLPTPLQDILVPLVGSLSFDESSIELSLEDGNAIRSFYLSLKDDSLVELDQLQIKSLKVDYVADQKASKEAGPNGVAGQISTVNGNIVTPEANGQPVGSTILQSTSSDTLFSGPISNATDISKPDPTSPTTSRLVLIGVIAKASTRARITIDCAGRPAGNGKLVSILMEPEVEGSLTVRGLLAMVNIKEEDVSVPRSGDSPGMFDIEITKVQAEASTEKNQTSGKTKMNMESFELAAQSKNSLDIFTAPMKLVLDQLRLYVKYKRASETGKKAEVSGILAGRLTIAEKFELWLSVVSWAGGTIYSGKLDLGKDKDKEGKALTLDSLASAIAMPADKYEIPDDLKFPKDLGIAQVGGDFSPKKWAQIYGIATNPWNGECLGVKLSVNNLSAYIRRRNVVDEKDKPAGSRCEVHVRGEVTFNGFYGARAWLCLSQERNSTFTVRVTQKEQNAKVEDLANSLGEPGSQERWDGLGMRPTNGPFIFGQSLGFLHVDFKTSYLLLFAQIQDLGAAIFIAGKNPESKKRDFYFALVARDLGKIWSDVGADSSDKFNVERLAVQVINFDTTVKELRELLDSSIKETAPPAKEIYDIPGGEPPARDDAVEAVDGTTKALANVPEDTKISKGASFFFTVSLSASSPREMTDVVAFGVESKEKALITVFANISKEKKDQKYLIDVRNLSLLGGCIEINGQGSYLPGDKTLDISAILALKGLLKDSKVLLFDVKLKKSPELVHFEVEGKTSGEATSGAVTAAREPEIQEPFGGMFSVTLKSLKITGDIKMSPKKEPESVYRLTGKAIVGKSQRQIGEISASVIFKKGAPCAVYLQYEPTAEITTSTVYGDIISKDGNNQISWPKGDYEDLVFKQVTACYVNTAETIDIDGVSYTKGFTIAARFSLFDKNFSARLMLGAERTGFQLEASYEQDIDLIFATLTKTSKNKWPSAGMSAVKNQVSFTFESGLKLFDVEGFEFSLKYTPSKNKSDRKFEGRAKYSKEVLGVKPDIGFTHQNGKWSFSGWDMLKDYEKFPMAEAIEKGSGDSKCGALVKMVFKEAINTEFKFKVGLIADDENKKPSSKSIWVRVEWTYNIVIVGKDIIPNLKLPTLPLEISGPYTISRLPEILLRLITDNLGNIGKAVHDDPASFVRLLAAVAFEKLAEETLARLICRGDKYEDKDKSAKKRAREKLQEKLKEIKDILQKVLDAAKAAGVAAAAAVAAAAIAEGVAGLAAAAPAIAGILGGVLGLVILKGLDQTLIDFLNEIDEKAKRDRKIAEDQLNLAKQRIREALTLVAPPNGQWIADAAAKDNAESVIRTQWKALEKMDFGDYSNITREVKYEWQSAQTGFMSKVQIVKGKGVDPNTQQSVIRLEDLASVEEWKFIEKVTISVRGVYDDGKILLEADRWMSTSVTHKPSLYPPVGFDFFVNWNGLQLSIPPTVQEIGDFGLRFTSRQLLNDKSKDLYSTNICKLIADSEVITLPMSVLGPSTKGHKLIQACLWQRSVGPNGSSRDSPSVLSTQSYGLYPAPENFSISMEKGQFILTWSQPPPFDTNLVQIELSNLSKTQTSLPGTLADDAAPVAGSDPYARIFRWRPRHDLTDGARLLFTMRYSGAPANTLALTTVRPFTFPVPPTPQIDPETSSFDVPSSTLSLSIKSPLPFFSPSDSDGDSDGSSPSRTLSFEITLHLRTSTSEITTTTTRVPSAVISDKAVVRLQLTSPPFSLSPERILAGEVLGVEVVRNSAENSSKKSERWAFPRIPRDLVLPRPFAWEWREIGEELAIDWPKGSATGEISRSLRVESEVGFVLRLKKNLGREAEGVVAGVGELNGLKRGDRVVVTRVVGVGNVVGDKERRYVVLS